MIAVIVAGGSGTRLWPLSTPDYPKHLLQLTGRSSLIQYTYERAKTIADEIYVITDASHAKHIKKQLPDLKENAFIVEPGRRGTANCFVLALKEINNKDSHEPIAFIHADHYVRDTKSFTRTFKSAERITGQTNRITLIGIQPNYPATGFGYIQKGDLCDETHYAYDVHSFKEKPDHDTANKFIDSGNYLWNCGYFVGSAESFLTAMGKNAPKLYDTFQRFCATKNKQQLEKAYLETETEAIEYSLIEKTDNLLVIPASFDWMDLGSYSDLHKASLRNALHNHVNGEKIELEGVENAYVYNSEDKPVAVIGLHDIVVVNTKDGLLVARKDLAKQVGEISKRFNKN